MSQLCKVNGGTEECGQVYWCPTVGEYESPCHGGFDVCCRRPDLHRKTKDWHSERGTDPR